MAPHSPVKFTFSEKTTKIEKVLNLTVCSNRQINGEDFVHFCGLLRKLELYNHTEMTAVHKFENNKQYVHFFVTTNRDTS